MSRLIATALVTLAAGAALAPAAHAQSWKSWEQINGQISSAPTAASRRPNTVDVVARGTDGTLRYNHWLPTGWVGWESPLPGTFQDKPAIVAWDEHRMDVFARSNTNTLIHAWWIDGEGWAGWQDLGGNLSSAPAVASWESGRLDVFWRCGTDILQFYGGLCHRAYNNSSWQPAQHVGSTNIPHIDGDTSTSFIGAPAAVSRSPHTIDIAVRANDSSLAHMAFDGAKWTGWDNQGGVGTSDPALASDNPVHLLVLIRGSDYRLYEKGAFPPLWFNWYESGGNVPFSGSPGAVSRAQDHVDVVV